MEVKEQIISTASFSEDRKHRYLLCRFWDNRPKAVFIGLNPSTANEQTDDATIRRVIRFARDWGYGGVTMMNLFTYVTPHPKELVLDDNKASNMLKIKDVAREAGIVIFAWGNFDVLGRDKEVANLIPNAYCLSKNKNGSPKHPLYCAANTIPVPYSTPNP